MEAYIFQYPLLLVISKPYIFKGNLTLNMFRFIFSFIWSEFVGIQHIKDAFCGNHTHLKGIELIDQLADRSKDHVDIHDKGYYHTRRNHICQDLLGPIPYQ